MLDPITMALCECECKENPEGGNAGGATVIDLSQYYLLLDVDGVPASIGDLVFMAFSNGGGSISGADESGFWDAVKASSHLKFILPVSSMSLVINADANSHVKDINGNSMTIEMSFLVGSGDGSWVKVTVVFVNSNGGSATIVVAVEPMSIPGA